MAVKENRGQMMKKEEMEARMAEAMAQKEKRAEEQTEQEKEAVRRSTHRLRFQIEASDGGETVWNYLTRKKGFTKMQVKRMKFQPGGICVDGEQVRVTHVLAEGERLEVSLEAAKQKNQMECEKKVEVVKECILLYEDTDVLAAWKPHGVPLHPSHGHHGDTFMEQVQEMIARRDGSRAADVSLRCIGRLDSDTSGIVLFARNQVAAQRLWQQHDDGRFSKQYLAKCEGRFQGKTGEEQCISQPIAPVKGELNRMQVNRAGKRAVTYYQIWREMEKETYLRVHLETGRTHQIRVHMAWLGHPLVGDSLYGNGTAGKTYAALSAYTAVFFQPFTGEKIILNYLDKAVRGE